MNAPQPLLSDALLLDLPAFTDHRGSFFECSGAAAFEGLPSDTRFVRSGWCSNPRARTLRGLHGQWGLGKLVSVVCGEAYDVIVDVRPGSPTYGGWEAALLSGTHGQSLWVPPGFAHGYMTLKADTTVLYQFTAPHVRAREFGVLYSDPQLAISWPGLPQCMSDRDRQLPGLPPAGAVRASPQSG
ncbi:MAG: dTDP-4-dehydrorhamnose 3,5-epimerase family protein [Myxococcota bacterium]